MSTLDKPGEECGVFGIMSHPEAARIAYLGLYALQHRGQASAGIVSSDGQKLYIEKDMGHVAEVFTEARLERLPGNAALGHVRYPAAGKNTVRNAQPIMIDCWRGQISLAHNGNLTNARDLRGDLELDGAIFHSTSDSEVIMHLMSRSRRRSVREAFVESLQQIKGAYSLIALTPEYMLAARDPNGFCPLCLGRVNGTYVVASETCALDLINAEYLRDVAPGEVLSIKRDRSGAQLELESETPLTKGKSAFCVFEHIYFGRPDSLVFGRAVYSSRHEMGKLLAKEHPVAADIVVPIPDSGVAASIGFSRESGIPLEFGLTRNHYVGRTFIEPKQSIRNFGVKVKLNPIREVLRGKRVVLVDDSIVRGTTSKKIVEIVRAAGAGEIHLRISSPPVIAPCYYGIDIPTRSELIGSTKSVDEIRDYVKADSLGYLSLESTLRAVDDRDRYCSACFSDIYPTEVISPDNQRILFGGSE